VDKVDGAVSLISAKTADSSKKPAADGDTFSKILEQKTGKVCKDNETGRDVIAKDRKGDEAAKHKDELDKRNAELQKRLESQAGTGSMANYLYNIVLKNPETMSLGEKQAWHMGEFSTSDGVGLKELQKMLSSRNLSLNDLTFSQIAQLTQRNSRGTINAFLDDLHRQMREGTLEKRMTKPLGQNVDMTTNGEVRRRVGEMRASQVSRTDGPTPGFASVERPGANGTSRSTESQSRREQRKNVIKQIIAHMEVRNFGERTELMFKLNPEYLGDLKVNLSTENGRLSARFETTSKEVRDMVEEGWHGLKDMFARKGLTLTSVAAQLVDAV
jgi:hypothetical protein